MDDSVKQAMAKWPNVPHCYGWLALDARGFWRMRDERAQQLDLKGDKIMQPGLAGFINRNYTHDEQGRWYFQNGPQRVYVELEETPYIVHTDPARGFVFHTGQAASIVDGAWMTETGRLIIESAGRIALVDDRDMAQSLGQLRIGDAPASDEQLLAWLDLPDGPETLFLNQPDRKVPVQLIQHATLAGRFGFVQTPHPDAPVSNFPSVPL